MAFEGDDRDYYTFILNAVNQAVTLVYLTAPKLGLFRLSFPPGRDEPKPYSRSR